MSDDVEAVLDELVAGVDGRAAVWAGNLTSGEEVAVGPVDERFPTGSAAKLLVLLAFADAITAGELDPDRRVRLDASDRDARGGSGVLRYLSAGLELTVTDCATLMMIVSDNVATDLLLDVLGGPEAVNTAARALGVTDIEITSPTVWVVPPAQFGTATPRGLAQAWLPVRRDDAFGALCRGITWRNQLREGFARRVPFSPDLPDFGLLSPLRLWSKSGAYPTVSCEAGLFETDRATWVLSVMADGLADWGNGSIAAGPTLRADVARALCDHWAG